MRVQGLRTTLLALLALLTSTFGSIYEHTADLPGLQYDFVIVGGGTAGLVVANRLTENPAVNVLVLEAGVSNQGVLDSNIPFFVNNLLAPNIYDWNYTTTPQSALNGRVIPYYRGHILGGCSAHNDMFYTRGSMDDFNRYAALTGDPGWSWDEIFPYFLKNEKWTPPADGHDTSGQFNPAVHSTHGLTEVSLPGFMWSLAPRVIQATRELPDEFPFNLDMNSGRPLGIGWLQSTIGHGVRSSSATAYLAPEFVRRGNLHVLLHARVTRLVGGRRADNGELMFGGVEFMRDGEPDSETLVAKAGKEIILSAGTVGTPHLLMHSGIGDRRALQALGITTLLDLPSVGTNVSDHPVVGLSWMVNSTQTLESITQNATAFNEAFAQWNRSHTGPFVDLGVSQLGWFRLDRNASIFKEFRDPAAGPDTPHFELGFGAGTPSIAAPPEEMPGHLMTIGVAVVSPVSRGTITLSSGDPLDPPLINPGYMTSDFDLYTLTEGLKCAQRFLTAPVWRDYVLAPTVDLNAFTPDELQQFIRNSTASTSHLAGSAGMSARGARYGVVDPDLRVKGVKGLRIIDASVLPIVPSAHTQATTYVFAERGSDLLKASWT
ncbi:aryl-alcohol oxidase-like protein [Mycena olivaceomarginata]|nr:aryl-alcohol oxidase-like protein [Mycena olivaceomarginata]